ncbi:Spo0B C-terminal domain-containing protein [Alkalihalobacterium alkalinitrilicum]|uniref:Spo0B C-terminal domain-containing protein n=1 Tax=Alkalihalobacterium alkalinitrilicum TaxID=427920 RepID=UPI001303135F|nr:sporulation initiation phosphotransferase B [Alkalihalobacterium alkalinitrilicum]
MAKPKEIINILSHSRHDWLNVMQLIKGNLALNRPERVEEIIHSVIQQSQNESKLSNLNIPAVVADLLTFNWENHYYELEIEVIGDVKDLSHYENVLHEWCSNLMKLIDQCCDEGTENHLLITFQLLEDEIKLIFDFQGQFKEISSITSWFQSPSSELFKITEKQISVNEMFFVVALK